MIYICIIAICVPVLIFSIWISNHADSQWLRARNSHPKLWHCAFTDEAWPIAGCEADINDVGHRQVVPPWKLSPPQPNVVIQPGDKVFISTNIFPDSFDGCYQVDKNGMVLPKYCGAPVEIGGLTEIKASKVVLNHACRQDVYNAKSVVRICVVRADRFPPKNKSNMANPKDRFER